MRRKVRGSERYGERENEVILGLLEKMRGNVGVELSVVEKGEEKREAKMQDKPLGDPGEGHLDLVPLVPALVLPPVAGGKGQCIEKHRKLRYKSRDCTLAKENSLRETQKENLKKKVVTHSRQRRGSSSSCRYSSNTDSGLLVTAAAAWVWRGCVATSSGT